MGARFLQVNGNSRRTTDGYGLPAVRLTNAVSFNFSSAHSLRTMRTTSIRTTPNTAHGVTSLMLLRARNSHGGVGSGSRHNPRCAAFAITSAAAGGSLFRRLLSRKSLEVPRKARLNLRKANIGAVLQSNDCDCATVAI